MPQRPNQINVTLSATEMEQLDRIRECRNPPCSRYALGKEAILDFIQEELSKIERGKDNLQGSPGADQVTKRGFYGDLVEIFRDHKGAKDIAGELFRPEKRAK